MELEDAKHIEGFPVQQSESKMAAKNPEKQAQEDGSSSEACPSGQEHSCKTESKQQVISCFGVSKQGAKEFQEDSWLQFLSPSGKVLAVAVFDGHGGLSGQYAATASRMVVLSVFEKVKQDCESWDVDLWQKFLLQLFDCIHAGIRDKLLSEIKISKNDPPHIVDNKGVPRTAQGFPLHGGCTATVVVVTRDKDSTHVISANVGDSAAVLVTPNSAAQFLTEDHAPDNPSEYQRVQSLSEEECPQKLLFVYDISSQPKKCECPRVFLSTGEKDPKYARNPWSNGLHPTNVRYEPAVYAVTPSTVFKDSTCIAMTRAVGDFYAQQFGLTHKPFITTQKLSADSAFALIVASDGVWDCWKYDDLAQRANKQLQQEKDPADKFVEVIITETLNRAVSNFGVRSVDDTTLVYVQYQ